MNIQDTQINVPNSPEQQPEAPMSKQEVEQKIISHYDKIATEKITGASNSISKLEQAIQ